jgi:cellulose synthase operon protein C
VVATPPDDGINNAMFVRVNAAAHDRFPHNLTFVRNLLSAYDNHHGTAYSPVKYEALLSQNWFYASDLRIRFLGLLTASGRLDKELAALPKAADAEAGSNTVALEFGAEGNAWLTRYETAAPYFATLDRLAPGDGDQADRAISVHRSLADSVPGAFDLAVREADLAAHADPHNHAALTRVGEIYADREQYAKAEPYWSKLATTDPRSLDGYLEAATVFWDYYQFNDARRLLEQGRRTLDNSQLYSYEAGLSMKTRAIWRMRLTSTCKRFWRHRRPAPTPSGGS